MTPLRIIGSLFGIIIFCFGFDRFRKRKLGRFDFIFSLLISSSLLAVSIFPNIAYIFLEMLALERVQFGRLIAISIFSNILLWLAVIYLRAKIAERDGQFDQLVRAMGLEEFEKHYPDSAVIKPITILIPALNEKENLASLLPRIPAEMHGKQVGALIIDDGSTDGTAKALRAGNYAVASNKANRGGGAALRLGRDIALKHGAEIIVTMDADGQHRPEEFGALVEPILSGEADFVIGSRILGAREKDSVVRYVGVIFFSRVINILCNLNITDCSSGYRAFRAEVLRGMDLRQDQFHTSEYIIEAAKKGIRITETPITILKRAHGESKKGKNWKYGLRFARTIAKTWWR